ARAHAQILQGTYRLSPAPLPTGSGVPSSGAPARLHLAERVEMRAVLRTFLDEAADLVDRHGHMTFGHQHGTGSEPFRKHRHHLRVFRKMVVIVDPAEGQLRIAADDLAEIAAGSKHGVRLVLPLDLPATRVKELQVLIE